MMEKKPCGIVRNRMADYFKAKGKKIVSKKRFSKVALRKTYEDQDDLIKSTLLSSTKTSEIQMTDLSEPGWMDDYKKCCRLLSQIDSIKDQIKREQVKKMTAIHQQKHDQIIQSFTDQATTKISQCEKILKGIQKINQFSESNEQRKIFTNMIMSLAMKIRDKAKELRMNQQQQLIRNKQLQTYNKARINPNEEVMNKDEEDTWLDEEGFQKLQNNLMKERNQQIMTIVKSISTLNTIYKQLQDLVIHQGSLLDRIDQNIDTTFANIEKANEHLTKAEEHQKNPCACRVITVLIILIGICLTILIVR